MGLFSFGKGKEKFFLDLSEKSGQAAPAPAAAQPTPAAKPAATATPKAKVPKVAKSAKAESAAAPAAPATEAPATPAEAIVEAAVVVTNFATDYLMPSGTPRRSPGPSLKQFMDMAGDLARR